MAWFGFGGMLALCSFLGVVQAFADPKPQFAGLVVQFKTLDPQAQDEIHARLHTRLEYRSKLQKIDIVNLAVAKLNSDARALEKICEQYRNSGRVTVCAPSGGVRNNLPVVPTTSCPYVSGAPISEAVVDANLKIGKEASCKPFPAQDSLGLEPLAPDDEKNRQPNRATSKLTAFWAQEEVGGPETRELVAAFKKNHALRKVPVGIIDGSVDPKSLPAEFLGPSLKACTDPGNFEKCGFSETLPDSESQKFTRNNASYGKNHLPPQYHGSAVANLMAGDGPWAMSSEAQFSNIRAIGTSDKLYVKALDSMLENPPEIVNLSMAVPEPEARGFKMLSQKTTVVAASGNSYPDPIDAGKLGTDAIIVGSTAPNGFPSLFSQEGKDVVITAPSNIDIMTKGPDGKFGAFGGTSGASPVVAGALTNVKALLPGISNSEIKTLLKNTAIPTTAAPGDTNGAGSLNEYKMMKVAALLAASWPGNRAALLAKSYDEQVASEANAELKSADGLLARTDSCEAQIKGLKALRRAFFLSPDNPLIRSKLARLYREQGYDDMATFFDNPATTGKSPKFQALKRDRGFLAAVGRGDLDATKRLLDQGADANVLGGDPGRRNAIEVLVEQRGIDPKTRSALIDLLIARGTKVIEPDERFIFQGPGTAGLAPQKSAWSLVNGPVSLVKQLIQASPDSFKTLPKTPLAIAAESGNIEVANYLFSNGADINGSRPNATAETPLMLAITTGKADMVKFLLDHKVDLNHVYHAAGLPANDPGFTALDMAAVEHPELIPLLKQYGATGTGP